MQSGDRRVVWKGRNFSVILHSVKYNDGSTHVHEQIEAPDVVRVYPLSNSGTIYLIREFRHDVDRWVTRVPAGRVQSGESPEQAAKRELREEVGLAAKDLKLLRKSQPVLKFNYTVWHYVASDLEQVSTNLEAGEEIEAFQCQLGELETLVFAGEIPEDSLALSLLHIARQRRTENNNR